MQYLTVCTLESNIYRLLYMCNILDTLHIESWIAECIFKGCLFSIDKICTVGCMYNINNSNLNLKVLRESAVMSAILLSAVV